MAKNHQEQIRFWSDFLSALQQNLLLPDLKGLLAAGFYGNFGSDSSNDQDRAKGSRFTGTCIPFSWVKS